MVSTRGNPVAESGRKSTLPSRESRRSTRGALQEPEDELFWDSDDQISRERRRTRRVNVTFKDAASPRAATGRTPGTSKDDSGMKIESSASDQELSDKTDSSEDSEEETLPRRSEPSCRRQDEAAGIEGDTDTDDDIFRRSHSRSTRGQRTKDQTKSRKKVYMMNGDDSGDVGHLEDEEEPIPTPSPPSGDLWLGSNQAHCEPRRFWGRTVVLPNTSINSPSWGVRRSLRRRKYKSFDQSWLVGSKKLRGYPRMVPSSEPENEEPRPARKLRRHISSEAGMVARSRRSSRFRNVEAEPRLGGRRRYSGADEEEFVSPSPRTRRRPNRICSPKSDHSDEDLSHRRNRRSVPPRRYREENSEEEEECKMTTRRHNKRVVDDDKEKAKRLEKMEVEQETATKDSRVRDKTKGNEKLKDEVDMSDDAKPKMPERRIRTRSTGEASDQKTDDTDDEEEEEEEEEEERDREEEEEEEEEVRKPKKPRDPIMARALSHPFEDIYSRGKRERRPVKRFMYEDEVKERRSVIKRASSSSESEDKDEDDDEEEEEDEEQMRSRYSLRQNRRESRPFQVDSSEKSSRTRGFREDSPQLRDEKRYVNSPARKHMFHRKRRQAAHNTSSSSSSSSDESRFEKRKARGMAKSRNRCLPMNLAQEDLALSTLKERVKVGSSLADIDPMAVDRTVTFDSVGGLASHVKALKEMIIFPLMYPEVFERFQITPPRGVLFYGPPGTGKTLVARALANECGIGDRKVAFFMRKGADCLSKWVGESERQLRLLFDQAYQMRPSIIFFDEIDGLAPVRSSRQDQIHSSIVSTLLALMDGLDSRGEVVVIGATNRIDAIDPALRRPGRFDREFNFPLPSYKSRLQILKIHTQKWDPVPSKKILNMLAQQTVGYCGADIKSLCAEAALIALRTKYPQIYASKQKLLIDVNQINIMLCHFRAAMSKIVAAGQRSAAAVGRQLSSSVQPLLQTSLKSALRLLANNFPHAFVRPFNLKSCTTHRPRLILTGLKPQGQSTHLAPAIIHALEKVPTHKLDLTVLYSVSARAPEEACAQVFHEARRNLPSIVYVPHIDQWWGTTSDTLRATFMSLLHDLDPALPVLLLATSDVPYDELEGDVQKLFSVYHEEVMAMTNPTEDERRQFFKPLFYTALFQKPKVRASKKQLEDLPLAPPPPQHQFNSKEIQRLEEIEEATLRELRIFLREICAKLARNRTFYMFTKPVDEEEVPDYREIIKEPMDLETMMTKIDHHQYESAQEFLQDIDLICNNALEYNPDRTPEDKIIRHRACTMRDTAYAYIKAEMDTDFEYKCREIRDGRKKRYSHKIKLSAPNFILTAQKEALEQASRGIHNSGCSSEPATPACSTSQIRTERSKSDGYRRKKRRFRNAWARGEIKQPRKKRNIEKDEKKELDDDNEAKPENTEDDSKKITDDEDRSEEDVSVHSTDTSDGIEINRPCSEVNPIDPNDQVTVESEVALFNGHLSTEDSHDSMRVTSAADELAAKASACSLTKDTGEIIREDVDDRSLDTTVDTEDSVVSSSEQGGGTATEKNGIIVDWNHLEAVYESCISATNGSVVDDLLRLYTSLSSLIKKHVTTVNRTHLLQEMEAEIRRFTQFHKKS